MAESTLELALLSQQDLQQLQTQEKWTKGNIVYLGNNICYQNLKLCGLPEGEEASSNLVLFISHWLATILLLEKGVAPLLNHAHRIGPIHHPNFKGPRDILIELTYDCIGNKKQGHLLYKDQHFLVLPDLASKVLQKWRQLKEIALTL